MKKPSFEQKPNTINDKKIGPSIVYASIFVIKNILLKCIEFVNEVFIGGKGMSLMLV